MDKVTLDGKLYERSAIVAKRYGYTADYLGQLSRAEKVDAQLVGRSWYVHDPSVEEYQASLEEEEATTAKPPTASSTKGSKHAATKNSSGTVEIESDDRSYHVDTHSGADEKTFISKLSRQNDDNDSATETRSVPVKKATPATETKPAPQRRARSRFSPAEPAQTTSHWQKVAYERDDDDLVPDVNKPCAVPPVFELGKKVRVHSNTDKFSIVASAMPEVPLRGQVAVHGLDEDTDDAVPFNSEAAGARVRKRLTELEPSTQSRHVRRKTEVVATADRSQQSAEETDRETRSRTPRSVSVWATRLAWVCTLLLLGVAIAGLFLAQETSYDSTSGSSFGIVFAPGDWLYRWWPF